MKNKLKVLFLGLIFSLTFVGGNNSNITKISTKQETVTADSYTTFFLSTGTIGWLNDNAVVGVQFSSSNESSSFTGDIYQMEKIYSYVASSSSTTGLLRITLKTDLLNTYIKFGRYKPNTNYGTLWNSAIVAKSSSKICYYTSGWNAISSVTSDNYEAYVAPSAATRRIWFRTSSSYESTWLASSALPAIYDGASGKRYFATQIYNQNEEKNFYYVDVPMAASALNLQRLNPSTLAPWNQTAHTSYTNQDLHRLLIISAKDETATQSTPSSVDEDLLNQVLKGFTTCVANDINGYLAYPDINTYWYSKYASKSKTLSEVYQDDFSYGDFDTTTGAYKSGAMKDSSGSVSCQIKIDMMSAIYSANVTESRNFFSNQYDSSFLTIMIISSLSLGCVLVYVYTRKKKLHQ